MYVMDGLGYSYIEHRILECLQCYRCVRDVEVYHKVVWVELEVSVDVVDDLFGSVLGEAAELQAGFVL